MQAAGAARVVRGKCFVTKDVSPCSALSAPLLLPCDLTPHAVLQNIDTDQIIPAEYLTLVPSKVWALHAWCLPTADQGVGLCLCCPTTADRQSEA